MAEEMVMIEMTEPQPPATPQALLALEKQLGVSLPDDYRRFVLKHNGGWSHDYGMTYHEEKGDASPQRLSIFHWFAVGLSKKQTGILGVEEVLKNMSGELPGKAVPFAGDDLGDPLLLMLEPSDYGSVYFFSFQMIAGNMIKLAGSFSEFINGLTLDRRRS